MLTWCNILNKFLNTPSAFPQYLFFLLKYGHACVNWRMKHLIDDWLCACLAPADKMYIFQPNAKGIYGFFLLPLLWNREVIKIIFSHWFTVRKYQYQSVQGFAPSALKLFVTFKGCAGLNICQILQRWCQPSRFWTCLRTIGTPG